MAAIRLAIASALLSPAVFRAARADELPRQVLRAAVFGGAFYAAHFGCWVWSLELTTVAASVTLVTATPLLLAVWAVLTGVDRPHRTLWLALGLATVGIAVIGGGDLGTSTDALVGDALALAGAAAMAGYMLVVRPLGPINVFAFTGIATAVGAAILSLTAVISGVSLAPHSAAAWGFLLLCALIPQLIGHSALTYSLRTLPPTTVGIATLGEPVGAAVLAAMFLSEVPSTPTVVGCAVTISAVGLALWSTSRK